MNTITIQSSKPEDIYFINELAKRLRLKANVTTDDKNKGRKYIEKGSKKEDVTLARMAFHTSSVALEEFFDNESEKTF